MGYERKRGKLEQFNALLRGAAELFSVEQLKQHAVMLAGQHAMDPYPGPDRLLPRLADNADVLRAAYDVLTAGTAQAEQRTQSGEIWLLDNFYLIEQQIILARRHLPVGYGKRFERYLPPPTWK